MTAWLAHPVTVLAVVVLVVNDHLLKAAYPGPVTGKLSDVAGLVCLPPLLSLVLAAAIPRRSGGPAAITGLAVSAVAFAVVKASPTGAAAASTVFSVITGPSVILADPTDLAALPALVLAALVWTRARRRPASRDTLRRYAVVVVLPTATLAIVATSAPEYPDTVEVTSWRNLVVVGQADAYQEQANGYRDRRPKKWLASDRGGAGWRTMTAAEEAAFATERGRLAVDAKQACVPGDGAHCYRVVAGHLRVEETIDAGTTWRVSWEVPDERRAHLARFLEGVGDTSVTLSSRALAVHPTPGGYVVVVANGRDGCAVRDPGGGWKRVAFGVYGAIEARPGPLTGPPHPLDKELVAGVLVALLAAQAGAWAATSRTDSGVTAIRIVAAAGVALTLAGAAGLMQLGWAGIIMGLVLTLGSTVGAFVAAATQVVHATRWVLLTLLSAVAIAGAWATSFLSWARGELAYSQAMLLAFAAAATGAVIAGWLGWLARRRPALVGPAQPPQHRLQ